MAAPAAARARTPLRWRGIRRWHVLERLARDRQWSRGAELGLLRGETYLHLLARLPGLTLIVVDILPAYREFADFVWGVPKARTRFAATLPGGCCKPSRSRDFTERRG